MIFAPTLRAPLMVLGLLLASCSGGDGSVITDVGNPPLDEGEFMATLHMELRQAPEPLVRVESAWVMGERFRLIDSQACSEEAPVDHAESYMFKVMERQAEALEFRKKRGSFCQLGLSLDPVHAQKLPAGAPLELTGASVVMRGERVSDGAPLRVVLRSADRLKLEAVGGSFSLTQREAADMTISFDTSLWWDEQLLEEAVVEPTGELWVDSEHNKELHDALLASMRSGAELYLDADEDGELSPAERAAPLASGGLVTP